MNRPLFVPQTPSAIHSVGGASLNTSDVTLYEDATVRVERLKPPSDVSHTPQEDTLRFTFTPDQNNLWLNAVGASLHLYAGTVLYQITPSSPTQPIDLMTGDGADHIYVDDGVPNPVNILAGPGNDYLRVGGRLSTIMSGEGDDTIQITSGDCTVESGAGNDSMHIVSAGSARIYAGEGDDRIQAGAGLTFIDGGPDDDIVFGGGGHNILSGGDGNDTIKAGSGTHVIYPGEGHNHVSRLKAIDQVYGQPDDNLIAITEEESREWLTEKLSNLSASSANQIIAVLFPQNADTVNLTLVTSSEAGKTGLKITGNSIFMARVEADLSVLRRSPNGIKLLQALDFAAQQSGEAVRIEPGSEDNARFTPSTYRDTLYIRGGQPGIPAPGGLIEYNPLFSPPGLVPIVGLYHELCHAYNAVTGTAVPGTTEETDGSKSIAIKNQELQAVGLPIAIEPFDFDLNPDTPPTRTNPEPYTENAIRKEFGLPVRTSYLSKR